MPNTKPRQVVRPVSYPIKPLVLRIINAATVRGIPPTKGPELWVAVFYVVPWTGQCAAQLQLIFIHLAVRLHSYANSDTGVQTL